MASETITLIYVVGVVISFLIFYYLIRSASGANERKKQLQLQNRILLEIAKNTGTDVNLVKELEDLNYELGL